MEGCKFDQANTALQILQFMKKRKFSQVKLKPKSKFRQRHALEEVKTYEKQFQTLDYSHPGMSYSLAEFLTKVQWCSKENQNDTIYEVNDLFLT